MSQSSKSADEAALEWLNTQGEALELRVARAMRRAQLETQTGSRYPDPETGKPREGDVTVTLRDRENHARALVVLECKHTEKKEKQWVGVEAEGFARGGTRPERWLAAGKGAQADRVFGDLVSHGVLDTVPMCSKVLTVNAHNVADASVRQAMSETWGIARQALATESLGHLYWNGAAIAVVVTTATLRTVHLDREGELRLRPAERFDVLVDSPDSVVRPVTVMSESALPAFAAALRAASSLTP